MIIDQYFPKERWEDEETLFNRVKSVIFSNKKRGNNRLFVYKVNLSPLLHYWLDIQEVSYIDSSAYIA